MYVSIMENFGEIKESDYRNITTIINTVKSKRKTKDESTLSRKRATIIKYKNIFGRKLAERGN